MKFKKIAAACIASITLCGSAIADVAYTNGSLNSGIGAHFISGGWAVSDSFVLSNTTNLTGATLGLWTNPGAHATSISWSIGASAQTSEYGSGTASLSNVYDNTNWYYDVSLSTFAFSATLDAGTYWLTISNATGDAGNDIYWDINNGPSTATQSVNGGFPSEQSGSNYFSLSGDANPVPEPASILLMGLGLASLCMLRRQRQN